MPARIYRLLQEISDIKCLATCQIPPTSHPNKKNNWAPGGAKLCQVSCCQNSKHQPVELASGRPFGLSKRSTKSAPGTGCFHEVIWLQEPHLMTRTYCLKTKTKKTSLCQTLLDHSSSVNFDKPNGNQWESVVQLGVQLNTWHHTGDLHSHPWRANLHWHTGIDTCSSTYPCMSLQILQHLLMLSQEAAQKGDIWSSAMIRLKSKICTKASRKINWANYIVPFYWKEFAICSRTFGIFWVT